MPLKPKKVIKMLIKEGFKEVPKSGGHRRFVHEDGRMTEVPMHNKELTPYTQRNIFKQVGWK